MADSFNSVCENEPPSRLFCVVLAQIGKGETLEALFFPLPMSFQAASLTLPPRNPPSAWLCSLCHNILGLQSSILHNFVPSSCHWHLLSPAESFFAILLVPWALFHCTDACILHSPWPLFHLLPVLSSSFSEINHHELIPEGKHKMQHMLKGHQTCIYEELLRQQCYLSVHFSLFSQWLLALSICSIS